MGSDKARITYDEKQQYRSVVMQQGRVTLEADWNEAQEIASEELSKDALDFVGPAGTPDDGYRVSSINQPKFDLGISPGTMYVGGERVELEKDIRYSNQTDWLDRLIDPDWIDLDKMQKPPAHEFVYLFLREQEVSAVEDSALRDVALGGPDTAARRRLIQHIVRGTVKGNACATGLNETEDHWKQQGLRFDAANMRLLSNSTLELGFSQEQPQPNPCEPSSQGGYLGADNQLIRVQVSNASPSKFLWGYDNASFLYRVDVRNSKTLALQSAPVDAFHEPKTGQAVEVLMAAAQLSNGEYVAAHSGFVTTVVSYVRDGQQLTLAKPLPAVYGDGDPKHPKPDRVFLRVWQEELPFTAGAAVALTQTGLTVKLKSKTALFHVGDFWQIAARPATPTKVYPERYLHGPQLPDGPRMWACPLAMINRTGNAVQVDDCRNPFDNLVELTKRKLGGCCTVTLRPQDVERKSLQSVIDSLKGKGPSKICLTPGVYLLPASLLLTEANSGLIIEACPGKATLRAATKSEAAFAQGVLVLNRADNVTLRGLSFDLPEGRVSGDSKDPLSSVTVSIGIRPLHCQGLTVEDCEFIFPTTVQKQTLFGVGIFAASQCAELRICGNRFIGGSVESESGRALGILLNPPLRLIAGFMHTPNVITPTSFNTINVPPTVFLRAALQNATIQRNHFERLTAAALILADAGSLAINENHVQECYAGFWLLALATLLANANPQPGGGNQTADFSKAIMSAVALIAWDPIMSATVLAALKYPLPADFDLVKAGAVKQAAKAPTVTESSLLNNAVEVMRLHFTGKAKSSTAEAKVVEAEREEFVSTGSGGVKPAAAEIFPDFAEAIFGFAPAAFQHELSLSLDFSHNDVSTVLQKLPWSTAFLIVDTDQVTDSQLTMSSNRLRSQSVSATAGVLFVNRCTVTGNVIYNELIEQDSLYLFAPSDTKQKLLPLTAITGNVFRGKPELIAPRPVFTPPAPPPMNTWEFFNTKVG